MANVTFDRDATAWDSFVEPFIRNDSRIIALRGAGSYNGIARETADRIVRSELHGWILGLPHTGHLVFMFDGDNDSAAFPDIGYIMGRLRDFWAGNVWFFAAQRDDWYSGNGKPIRNKTDYPESHSDRGYETFVFPHGVFPEEHSRFTQSARLVSCPNYHQVYVGACGIIARAQLDDLNSKVPAGKKVDIAVFRCKVNPEQTERIMEKIAMAKREGDAEKVARMEAALRQREQNPYGLLYSPSGDRLPFWDSLSNINFREFHIE
ncbi:MAG TPA: hypothetical protein VN495_00145 [Candidatus Paceibacterota bacterium]|nr:hypothetical protein [Candidatus Paceibacterota bacterium]